MAQLNWVRQQQSGGQVMTDEMGRPLLNEDGTSRMTTVDPNSINEWNNGKTGNEGVSYAYDPATDSFRMTQGDATSGFHRWTANQQGTQDLGFEDYDRNSKYKQGLGTIDAITAERLLKRIDELQRIEALMKSRVAELEADRAKALDKEKKKVSGEVKRSKLKINLKNVQINEQLAEAGGSGAVIYNCLVDGWQCAMKEMYLRDVPEYSMKNVLFRIAFSAA
ncbi:MAG: hypothetical protein ACK5PF_12470 [bacterium]